MILVNKDAIEHTGILCQRVCICMCVCVFWWAVLLCPRFLFMLWRFVSKYFLCFFWSFCLKISPTINSFDTSSLSIQKTLKKKVSWSSYLPFFFVFFCSLYFFNFFLFQLFLSLPLKKTYIFISIFHLVVYFRIVLQCLFNIWAMLKTLSVYKWQSSLTGFIFHFL